MLLIRPQHGRWSASLLSSFLAQTSRPSVRPRPSVRFRPQSHSCRVGVGVASWPLAPRLCVWCVARRLAFITSSGLRRTTLRAGTRTSIMRRREESVQVQSQIGCRWAQLWLDSSRLCKGRALQMVRGQITQPQELDTRTSVYMLLHCCSHTEPVSKLLKPALRLSHGCDWLIVLHDCTNM